VDWMTVGIKIGEETSFDVHAYNGHHWLTIETSEGAVTVHVEDRTAALRLLTAVRDVAEGIEQERIAADHAYDVWHPTQDA
jgi:hypothetical protein